MSYIAKRREVFNRVLIVKRPTHASCEPGGCSCPRDGYFMAAVEAAREAVRS